MLPPNALEENVYAMALSKDQVENYCNQCLTTSADLKKCSACRKMSYCSQECQRADWSLHKAECKAIQTSGSLTIDSVRLVLRIVSLLAKNELGEVSEEYIPGGKRSFLNLEDHGSTLDADAEIFAAEFLKFAVAPHPDLDLVKNVFKKVSINSFAVSNTTGNAIGIGLCIKLSAANHSCKPVTRVCYRQRTAILVPVGDKIPTSLADACHSYIDDLMPIGMRREALKKKYQFDCACEGCLDEERNIKMEAWSCGCCIGGLIQNKEGAKCQLCQWEMTPDHYEICRVAEASAIEMRTKLEAENIPLASKKEICEKLIELFNDTLHNFNVHRIPVLRCLYIAALADQNIVAAVRTGVALLSIMLEYQSANDPAVLYQKYQLSQLFLAAGMNAEAAKLLGDIREPLEKIYTKHSTIVRNVYIMIVKVRNSN